jgi:hypothetical protein
MKKGKDKRAEPVKPYRRPALRVHGDIRELTRVKGGTSADGGGGKPRTHASGPQT